MHILICPRGKLLWLPEVLTRSAYCSAHTPDPQRVLGPACWKDGGPITRLLGLISCLT